MDNKAVIDDYELELIRICDWMIANVPDALRPGTTIADDAIVLMTMQKALIEDLGSQLAGAKARQFSAMVVHDATGPGKTHTVSQLLGEG